MSTPTDPGAAYTFPQLVRAAAAAYGDDVAITLKGKTTPDESITFSELDRQSAALAKGLIARGVGKGTRVGFIYGNNPSFALMLAAISRIGGIAVPISTMIKSNELVRVLRQSDVSGLIVQRKLLGKDYVDRVCDALPEMRESDNPDLRIARTPFLRWIVSSGHALPPSVHDQRFLLDAVRTVSEDLLLQVESEVHPTDQMIEIYTSGSMALPKGVKHNHGPVLHRVHYLRSKSNAQRGMQLTVFQPTFWVGGLMMSLLPNWEVGATTVCTEGTSTNSRMAMGSVLAEEDMKAMPKGAINLMSSLELIQGSTKVFETPVVQATALNVAGRDAVAVQLDVPLDKLKPGTYVCQVNVIDDAGASFSFPRMALKVMPVAAPAVAAAASAAVAVPTP